MKQQAQQNPVSKRFKPEMLKRLEAVAEAISKDIGEPDYKISKVVEICVTQYLPTLEKKYDL